MSKVDLTELFGAIDAYVTKTYGPKIHIGPDGPRKIVQTFSPLRATTLAGSFVTPAPAAPRDAGAPTIWDTGSLSDEAQGLLTPGALREDGTIDWSLVR